MDSVSGSLLLLRMPEDCEPNAAPCRWLLTPSHIHLSPASLTCQSHDAVTRLQRSAVHSEAAADGRSPSRGPTLSLTPPPPQHKHTPCPPWIGHKCRRTFQKSETLIRPSAVGEGRNHIVSVEPGCSVPSGAPGEYR